jgi:hypothetical protein
MVNYSITPFGNIRMSGYSKKRNKYRMLAPDIKRKAVEMVSSFLNS